MSAVVYVYNADLVLINQFDSISDAALATGVSRWRIGRAIKANNVNLVDGYIFRSSPL